MSSDIRELTLEDEEQVKDLCETIWNGNDYVPEVFTHWLSSPQTHTLGVFIADELIAFGNLEKLENTNIAWIQGLRVKEGHREKGKATAIVCALIEAAKKLGIRHLWYATSSRNVASMRVAIKCGFHIADRTGYFRIYQPFPPHSKPSVSIVPLKVSPERLHELLEENPEIVESDTFPLAWHFDFKTLEGLNRLLNEAIVKVVIDETGKLEAIYCLVERERKEEKTAAYTVFATNRAIFVDIMSRMIDQAEAIKADRAVFFLGSRVSEWAQTLGYVDEEFVGREFLLYELDPAGK